MGYLEIKSWLDGKVLYAGEAENIKQLLEHAVIDGARLDGARLDRASLVGARLDRASLVGASLDGASLDGASLVGASLDRASLVGARLVGASLDRASLDGIKHDFWGVLIHQPREVAFLRAALVAGEVDGSTYDGPCACLIGTLAHGCGLAIDALKIKPDATRLSEIWFLAIAKGDTPETSQISRITLQWLDEWMALIANTKPITEEIPC